jgi:general stress protein 26
MNKMGIIYVGTCNKAGIPNISFRRAFLVDKDSLLWGSWYERNTYRNIHENNYVTVLVADTTAHTGYQMKGHVELLADPEKVQEFMQMSKSQPHLKRMLKTQQTPPLIVSFKPETLYKLDIAESPRNYEPIRVRIIEKT